MNLHCNLALTFGTDCVGQVGDDDTAVIGWVDDATSEGTIGVYSLGGYDPTLVVPSDAITITDESIEQAGGTTILRFTIEMATGFPGEGPYDLLGAFSDSGQDVLSYHGSTRTGFQLPSL
eukprot:TRINITY_DN4707_c0_g2_i2.p2 TRINITY_DN4707_c0_g2~~TRINITY_DN4707_c0_g2_i2.p2  ORF type:complete len:120 (-),score=22.57 TRINITY_DN4707_c0_g2_i2:296-655(-)